MIFHLAPDLSLRRLQAQDADRLFRLVDANRLYLRQWLPWLDSTLTPEDSRVFIERIDRQDAAGLGFACGVFWRGDLVGMCGFHPINTDEKSVTIGYWLAESCQGQGIITRAARFCIDYAFDHLGLHKAGMLVAEQNVASRAVCARLGLRVEGRMEKAEWLYDRWVTHIHYGVDAPRWRDLNGA